MSAGSKLTTQNLLTSDALYETPNRLDLSSIQDLCTLIDLFCLYDSIQVLGEDRKLKPILRRGSSAFSKY
jgi:hypothetical protein